MINQLIKYGLVGVVGTAGHYITLILGVEALKVNPTIATCVGFLVGACINYVLNYQITFKSSTKHGKALPRFMIFALIGFVINLLLFQFITNVLLLHYFVAQLMCTVLVMFITFVLNKKYTF